MNYKRIVISVLAGLLVMFLIIQFVYNSKPKFDGRITLNRKSKAPYGTYVAHEMLKETFGAAKVKINKQSPINWDMVQLDSGNQALVIIDNFFDPTETDLDYLTGFAQKGNIVLISAMEMNETAQKFFHLKQPNIYDPKPLGKDKVLFPDSSFGVVLDTNYFATTSAYYYPGARYGNYFTESNPTFTYSLGYNVDSTLNMVAIDAQAGSIYLHAAPAVFTNFFLLYRDNYTYYKQLLDLIPVTTKQIYWDEYFLRNKNQPPKNNGKGLLSVVLEYPAFKWAFWFVLILAGVFMLTEIQRRQRWVPQNTKPANESVNFVETVGHLYFEKGNNRNMADKLTVLFLEQIRSRFGIHTNQLDAEFVKKLSLTSGVELAEVTVLIDKVKEMHLMHAIDDATLKEYYFLLDHFIHKI